jgi:hypothetical protein
MLELTKREEVTSLTFVNMAAAFSAGNFCLILTDLINSCHGIHVNMEADKSEILLLFFASRKNNPLT